MTPRSTAPEYANSTLDLVRHLIRQQRVLVEKISRVEALGEEISFELFRFERRLVNAAEPNVALAPDRAPAVSAAKSGSQATEALRQAAETGASELELRWRADGSALVRVDGGKPFAVAPLLADLLTALTRDVPRRSELPDWQTIDEVGQRLADKTGKKLTRHAVAQAVYRLRQTMLSHGANPFLVQTNRRYGMRFALRTLPVVLAS